MGATCIRDVRIKQVQKCNSLSNVVTNDEKCDIKIQIHIGILKDALQKLNKLLRDRKKKE